ADIVDGQNVRMVERSSGLGLAREAGDPIGAGCEAGRERLDGDIAVETIVARAIDCSHSAFAKLLDNSIGSDERPVSQAHGRRSELYLLSRGGAALDGRVFSST